MFEHNLLLVIDQRVDRIVWSMEYTDWPRMIPLDPELLFVSFRGISNNVSRQDIIKFNATVRESALVKLQSPSIEEQGRIILLREKCRLCWRWLKTLYDWQRLTISYLPNIPVGKPNSNERLLWETEQQKLADYISIEIADFHHLIWTATNHDQLIDLADKMFDRRDWKQLVENTKNNINITTVSLGN